MEDWKILIVFAIVGLWFYRIEKLIQDGITKILLKLEEIYPTRK